VKPSFLEGKERRHEFLCAFEDGTLPAEDWTHAAHIAMATVYLERYGESVLAHVRRAIRNYLLARGKPVTAYHETLTIFWLAVVAQTRALLPGLSEDEAVLRLHAMFGENSKLHIDFYSFDVVSSEEARSRWIAPDLKPLPVPFLIYIG
jgi:hypothetical protein